MGRIVATIDIENVTESGKPVGSIDYSLSTGS